jgi:FlaA1/EpsC-like NDP-sugar epimerase
MEPVLAGWVVTTTAFVLVLISQISYLCLVKTPIRGLLRINKGIIFCSAFTATAGLTLLVVAVVMLEKKNDRSVALWCTLSCFILILLSEIVFLVCVKDQASREDSDEQ